MPELWLIDPPDEDLTEGTLMLRDGLELVL
jgi:hypothetical protein